MPRLDYRYPTPLEPAVLLKRYKRFLADVRHPDGSTRTVHLANPGSMRSCGGPGSAVRIRDSGNPKRKLPYSLEQIRCGRAWVAVNTALPNLVVGAALARGAIPGFDGFPQIRPEVSDGEDSRLDFLLEGPQGRCWIEVKNTTLREAGEAQFPDSVTSRGLKHLHSLTRLRARGDRAVMLYLVSRADVSVFRPAWDIDPAYAAGLCTAHAAGVEIVPVRCTVTPLGLGAGPVLPYHLARE
jgi:sugar fermentation stimulation protein A